MRRQGQLFEQMASFGHLRASALRAAKGKRLSFGTALFLVDLERQVLRLHDELHSGSYHPGQYLRFTVNDPKTRVISAAPFRDRVVHHALCSVLEPRLESFMIFDSYACRRGKGTVAALLRAQVFSGRNSWFLKLDIRRFFETASHERLKSMLGRLIKDRRVLWLADRFIQSGALPDSQGKGIPIGNLTSQHFANTYLSVSDHFIKEQLGVKCYIRYMDDMLLFSNNNLDLKRWRDVLYQYFQTDLDVNVKQEATVLDRVSEGVPFLGFRVWPHWVRLDGAGVRRLRRNVRSIHKEIMMNETDIETELDRLQSMLAWADLASGPRSIRAALGREFLIDIESHYPMV